MKEDVGLSQNMAIFNFFYVPENFNAMNKCSIKKTCQFSLATSRLTDKNGTVLILQCNPPVTRRHTLTFLTKAAKNLAKEYCFEIPCERYKDGRCYSASE